MQVYAETKRYRCSENCSVPSCKKNCVCVAFLLIPILGKRVDELEVAGRIRKNLVLCLLHFTTDSFTNKAQFDAGFPERLKLKDDAVPTVLDPTVMSQHTCE